MSWLLLFHLTQSLGLLVSRFLVILLTFNVQNTQSCVLHESLEENYANSIQCISLRMGIRDGGGVAGLEHAICKCRWLNFISCQMLQFHSIFIPSSTISISKIWIDWQSMGDIELNWKLCGETICFMLYEHTTDTNANRTQNLPFWNR